MNLLLDTCALIWAIAQPDRIPADTRKTLETPDTSVSLSPISIAEIACAVQRGRLIVAEHWKLWLRRHVSENGWEYKQIGSEIMEEAYSLPEPFHADPADRIIVATARFHRMQIVTGDSKILVYPHVDCFWQ
jgi:PIN domain nuclease of toxin-antitoxin system